MSTRNKRHLEENLDDVLLEKNLKLSNDVLPLQGDLSKYKFKIKDRNILKDKMGRYLTAALFVEQISSSNLTPIFTLNENDVVDEDNNIVYRSLKKIYLAYLDPTEYLFAMELFGSYEYWLKLLKCTWFARLVPAWRLELQARVKAMNYHNIVKVATEGRDSRQSYDAMKFLTTNSFDSDGNIVVNRGGRPKKEKEQAPDISEDILADAKRLGMVVVKQEENPDLAED